MSQLGLGVMIQMLGGNEDSVETYQKMVGKTITDIKITDERVTFTFEDGLKAGFEDDGQSCCEHRYLTCDDTVGDLVGATFLEAELSQGPSEEGEWDNVHETMFLKVQTSKGPFTVTAHNAHNGYYGGFWVVAKEFRS